MTKTSYPVLLEQALPPPQRRVLGARRDPAELPTPDPGTVLVFRVGGQYEEARADGHLRGTEPNVVNATAVSVVDVRERLLPVELTLHSARPADDFVVRLHFRCRVTRASSVAQAALTDLAMLLASHIQEDDKLRTLTTDFTVEEINAVRRQVDARIRAYWMLAPPQHPGIEIGLVSVEVLTPGDLRTQSRRVRDARWDDELRDLASASEGRDVDRIAELIRQGPEVVAALGVSRNEINVGELLAQLIDDRRQHDERLMEITRALAKDGHFDRIPIDARAMVDAFLARATGASPAAALKAETVSGIDNRRSNAARSDDLDEGPQDVPDEDDLAGQ